MPCEGRRSVRDLLPPPSFRGRAAEPGTQTRRGSQARRDGAGAGDRERCGSGFRALAPARPGMTGGRLGVDVPGLFLTRFPSCAVVQPLACTEGAAVITGLAAQAGRSCGGWGWCPADSGGRAAPHPPLGHYEPGAQREPRRGGSRLGSPIRERFRTAPERGCPADKNRVGRRGDGPPLPTCPCPPDAPASQPSQEGAYGALRRREPMVPSSRGY